MSKLSLFISVSTQDFPVFLQYFLIDKMIDAYLRLFFKKSMLRLKEVNSQLAEAALKC